MPRELTDNSEMPFGKYAGEKMANIPAQYLLWMYDNNRCTGSVLVYITANLDVLRKEVKL